MTDDEKNMQKSMGLASMQKPVAPAQSPAVAAMPASAIAKLSRRQSGSSDLMGLGGMMAAAQKAQKAQKLQQARNRAFSARQPAPTPFVSTATTRTAVAQGYEIGSPNSGPQVIRDVGGGKYAIGNNPDMQTLVDANQFTNLRHYFS